MERNMEKSTWPDTGTVLSLALMVWGNPRKTSVRENVLVKIQNVHLQNTGV